MQAIETASLTMGTAAACDALGVASAAMFIQGSVAPWGPIAAVLISVVSAFVLWSQRRSFIVPSDERMDITPEK